ncbi:flagellar biosynthetic protein FliO [Chromobacterium sp. IIBBL 290-4]|uniref:flagellar biosynthetic protein FliO n=1 Tax=Chromobacterium sp. IIBBL 290-4 TaxID=2953890 RepID=UPI0020B65080|nr:flagellar biosynthetic protein FliO [Chromobacterium sp. IIBBL 290-4]UTH74346.1 flagellar biosynthetic protein FliO [Chromobacterium sp. IIBBL 290-4]
MNIKPVFQVRLALPGAFCVLASAMASALPAAAPVAPSPSPFVSLLQVVLALAVVLGAIVGVAWLLRRVSGGMLGTAGRVRVVGGAMVGQKERVVIVELEGEWLVLGVTPNQVNLLNKMPRPEGAETAPQTPAEPFARWLKQALDKSRAGAATRDKQ